MDGKHRERQVGPTLPAAIGGRAGTDTRRFAIPAVLMLLPLAVSIPSLGRWCSLTPDSFDYLENARALLETGHFPPQALVRPPGFSTILAPLMALGELPLLEAGVLFTICGAASTVLTFRLWRRELGDRAAFLAATLVATSPVMLSQNKVLLSEPVFLPCSLLLLLVLGRWWTASPTSLAGAVGGGLLAAAVTMIRSSGWVIAPLLVLALLRHRPIPLRGRLACLAVYLICLSGPHVAWNVRQSAYPRQYAYGDVWTKARPAEQTNATGLALQAERLARFGPLRLESIKAAMLPKILAWRAFQPPLETPLTCLVGGGLVLLSIVRLLRRRAPLDAYALVTVLMLSLWPWNEGERFVTPLVPIFAGQLAWLGQSLWRSGGAGSFRRRAIVAVIAMVFVVQAAELVLTHGRLEKDRAKSLGRLAASRELAGWLKANTPPESPWLAVLPEGSNLKAIVLGAAYLARRPLEMVDVLDRRIGDLPLDNRACAAVHQELLEAMGPRQELRPTAGFGQLVVLKPEARPSIGPPPN